MVWHNWTEYSGAHQDRFYYSLLYIRLWFWTVWLEWDSFTSYSLLLLLFCIGPGIRVAHSLEELMCLLSTFHLLCCIFLWFYLLYFSIFLHHILRIFHRILYLGFFPSSLGSLGGCVFAFPGCLYLYTACRSHLSGFLSCLLLLVASGFLLSPWHIARGLVWQRWD